ncbi:MAG: hypothetical protein IJL04_01370 [Bacteroidales bacterium]|nr:hypothetical protein [Bacteroidales bacterium]
MRAIIEGMIENYRKEIKDLQAEIDRKRVVKSTHPLMKRKDWVTAKMEAAKEVLAEIEQEEHPVGETQE